MKQTVISKPHLLIGEGLEEVHFFTALLKNTGIRDVQVLSCGGVGNLSDIAKTLVDQSGFALVKALVLTRDADDNPRGAKQSIEAFAEAIREQARAKPPPICNVRVETFVMPGNDKPGALEDLVLESLSTGTLDSCIDSFFRCRDGLTPALPDHTHAERSKAKVRAWLAAQKPPDLLLGIAAQKGWIDWSSPAFNELQTFLNRAFSSLP